MIDGLSKRLREKRMQYGYSRKVVAENIGVSDSTIADYENNHVEPSTKKLVKLAALYKCSTDYLLGLDNPNSKVLLDASDLSPEQIDIVEKLIHVMSQK